MFKWSLKSKLYADAKDRWLFSFWAFAFYPFHQSCSIWRDDLSIRHQQIFHLSIYRSISWRLMARALSDRQKAKTQEFFVDKKSASFFRCRFYCRSVRSQFLEQLLVELFSDGRVLVSSIFVFIFSFVKFRFKHRKKMALVLVISYFSFDCDFSYRGLTENAPDARGGLQSSWFSFW